MRRTLTPIISTGGGGVSIGTTGGDYHMGSPGSKHVANTASALQDSIFQHVRYSLGKDWQHLSGRDLFMATALAARDRLLDRMLETEARYQKADAKRLYYLSIEFLIGRSLENNLCNLGILDLCQGALRQVG